MKQILYSLRSHLKADFRWDVYGTTALFLGFLVTLNYSINLEQGIIDSYRGNPIRILWYFLMYAFSYYGGTLIWIAYKKEWRRLQQAEFWLYSLFILGILGLDGGFYAYNDWSKQLFNGQIYNYAFHCLTNLTSVLTVFIPLGVFYYFIDRQRHCFYGFHFDGLHLRSYFLLVTLMIPLIGWASFQPDFLRFYPSYKDSNADEFFGVSPWVTTLIYEISYGFDFVATELIIRGFMVIGMALLIGRGAIVPMTVCYASMHFGKPVGETIGSIFGGYILGVIAFESRSIWGGIIVHVGVAWLMDAAAWLQKV